MKQTIRPDEPTRVPPQARPNSLAIMVRFGVIAAAALALVAFALHR